MTDAALPEIKSLWDYDNPALSELRFRETLLDTAEQADLSYTLQLKTQLARSLGLQNKFAEADAVLDEVEASLNDAPPVVFVRYQLERGRVRNSSGDKLAARPLFQAALEKAEACGEDGYALDAVHMLAIAHSGREALQWNLRGIALAEASQNEQARNWLGPLYNNTGWTYHDDFQEYEKALDLFERGVRFRTKRQQKKETQIAHWCVARAFRSLKRYDEALAIQQRLLAEHAADGTDDGFVHEELAECLLALGTSAEAPRHAALAHEQLSQLSWFAEESPHRLERLAGIAAGSITI